ncbi:MAG TPA: hypothetical protein V6C96_00690 [Vampirovibrionales bacterium]
MLTTKNKLKEFSQIELEEELSKVELELDKFFTQVKHKIEKPREKSLLRRQRARIITFLKNLQQNQVAEVTK